jgi:serine protease Do
VGFVLLAAAGLVAVGTIVAQTKPPAPSDGGVAVPVRATLEARPNSQQAAAEGTNFAKQLSAAFHNAAAKVLPAVVTITNSPLAQRTEDLGATEDNNSNDAEENPLDGTPFGDLFRSNPEFRHFFKGIPPQARGEAISTGSGIIIDSAGVILTNTHVVQGDGKVTVRLPDGREFQAQDIKTDPKTDLAIVRIRNGGNLPAAKLGDSEAMDVGDWVLALGQPFGLEGTVTAGIISAKGRGLGLAARENFLQTDAAINPGNSGGPLVNLEGEVIGINTAISTQNGGYQGVGFAIPANLAKWVAHQLIDTGKVRRAYLGVMIQPVTQQLAEQFGVTVHQGAVVTDVPAGTPAAKASVKAGDIIVEFAGKKVSSPQQLQEIVEETAIGSRQHMAVVREGKPVTLDVVPAEQPADYGLARSGVGAPGGKHDSSRFDKLGIQAETLTAEVAKRLGVKTDHGVVISDVRAGSPAALAGLGSGMVIVQANRKPVASVEELEKILGRQSLDKGVLLLIQSDQGTRFVVIRAEG